MNGYFFVWKCCHKLLVCKISSYMRSPETILRWNLDLSSFITDESISFPLAKSILPRWRIAATTLKIASWRKESEDKRVHNFNYINTCWKEYLLLFSDSNNIHSSPSGKVVLCVTHTNQIKALRLIKIME